MKEEFDKLGFSEIRPNVFFDNEDWVITKKNKNQWQLHRHNCVTGDQSECVFVFEEIEDLKFYLKYNM